MTNTQNTKNILSIAGSDPSGGAGIQADLKSIAATGGYGMAAISALTAQNTRGVRSVHVPPAGFLTEQLNAVSEDIAIDAIKIGMLANAEVINELGQWLAGIRSAGTGAPAVVLDPVMVATSGDRLLDAESDAALRRLFCHTDVITPNIPELAVLARAEMATDWETAVVQARGLAAEYGVMVLAKGGHLESASCRDGLIDSDGVILSVASPRQYTPNTHGTGCSLSAALATCYARTGDWGSALLNAKSWLAGAISRADELSVGSGHGPINHFASLWDGVRPAHPGDPMAQWWQKIAAIRTGIDELDFIRALKDGSLAREHFEDYLGQDALYLRTYSQVMSRASALAPDTESQRFWAASASSCLEEELALHRGRLAERVPEPSTTTTAYLNHLKASANNYPVLIAAILPCFWIYQDTGSRLAAANRQDHPYADWLTSYSSVEFDAATAAAIDITRTVHQGADESTRTAMWRAFEASSLHELAFFDQTAAPATSRDSSAGEPVAAG
ncbi:bifunctional hydroxymethylpyrimidine kinase/phosphomethylpyrimidine kinase [Paeniglutamicibacter antarcticus]|uniref:Hydroxymethylpyrimidine kinase n=1 Tax=Paeniglutamicibacter antarcticus TaxID=494023 RepID=A0ABP9TLT8_9MICC